MDEDDETKKNKRRSLSKDSPDASKSSDPDYTASGAEAAGTARRLSGYATRRMRKVESDPPPHDLSRILPLDPPDCTRRPKKPRKAVSSPNLSCAAEEAAARGTDGSKSGFSSMQRAVGSSLGTSKEGTTGSLPNTSSMQGFSVSLSASSTQGIADARPGTSSTEGTIGSFPGTSSTESTPVVTPVATTSGTDTETDSQPPQLGSPVHPAFALAVSPVGGPPLLRPVAAAARAAAGAGAGARAAPPPPPLVRAASESEASRLRGAPLGDDRKSAFALVMNGAFGAARAREMASEAAVALGKTSEEGAGAAGPAAAAEAGAAAGAVADDVVEAVVGAGAEAGAAGGAAVAVAASAGEGGVQSAHQGAPLKLYRMNKKTADGRYCWSTTSPYKGEDLTNGAVSPTSEDPGPSRGSSPTEDRSGAKARRSLSSSMGESAQPPSQQAGSAPQEAESTQQAGRTPQEAGGASLEAGSVPQEAGNISQEAGGAPQGTKSALQEAASTPREVVDLVSEGGAQPAQPSRHWKKSRASRYNQESAAESEVAGTATGAATHGTRAAEGATPAVSAHNWDTPAQQRSRSDPSATSRRPSEARKSSPPPLRCPRCRMTFGSTQERIRHKRTGVCLRMSEQLRPVLANLAIRYSVLAFRDDSDTDSVDSARCDSGKSPESYRASFVHKLCRVPPVVCKSGGVGGEGAAEFGQTASLWSSVEDLT